MSKLGVSLFYVFSLLCLMSVISLVDARFATGRYSLVDIVVSIYFLVSAVAFLTFRIDRFLGFGLFFFTLSLPFILISIRVFAGGDVDYVGVCGVLIFLVSVFACARKMRFNPWIEKMGFLGD